MADTAQVVIKLATGLEDAERVTVAFLVGGAAVERRKQVAISLTKEAVRLPCRATPRRSHVTAARRSFGTSSSTHGGGSLLASPICFSPRKLDQGELVANGQLGGATALWEWIGDDGATVFSH
jgi:hypothetical protein